MDDALFIRVWLRDAVPERFRYLIPLNDYDNIFLAHVPTKVLADQTYRACNGVSGIEGWMPEGMLGLFGINALTPHPHPEGDGLLLVGSQV